MTRYNWPGNVRELENEMERAVTMAAGGDMISPDLLSEKLRPAGTSFAGAALPASGSLKDTVHRVERQMIEEALAASGGNRSQAAKNLGLSRQGLLNKISSYRISID